MGTPRPLRIVRNRPRLFGSLGVGVVVALVLAAATAWRPASRLLIAWDVCLTLCLVLASHLMAASTIDHMRQRAAVEDEGQVTILVLTFLAWLGMVALTGESPGSGVLVLQFSSLGVVAFLGSFLSGELVQQMGALAGFESFKSTARVNLISGTAMFPLTAGGAILGGLDGTVRGLVISTVISCVVGHLTLRREAVPEHWFLVEEVPRNPRGKSAGTPCAAC